MKIGYQGYSGAYSNIASQYFAKTFNLGECQCIGFDSFTEVFDALLSREIDVAAIPIENSYAGRVAEVHNIIRHLDLVFLAEYILKVSHNLVIKKGSDIKNILRVCSHEQAVMQCTQTLKQIFAGRKVDIKKMQDTALSAKEVAASDGTMAGICSSLAAKIYDVEIVREAINDSDQNYTTFILISASSQIKSNLALSSLYRKNLVYRANSVYITSIIITLKNISGAIYNVLGCFAEYNINLIKLESYIPGGVKSGQAEFFISFFGHIEQESVLQTFANLQGCTSDIRILGSYLSDEKRI